MSKRVFAIVLGIALLLVASTTTVVVYNSAPMRAARMASAIDDLVARNVAARGGADAWRAVTSLELTGEMSVGDGSVVPYVLRQERPQKLRFELILAGQTMVQGSDGTTGWKLIPFRGSEPEPMTEEEIREAAPTADLYGLLFDYAERGHVIDLEGDVQVDGRDAYKLKVTLPGDVVRWVYLDAETGLEIKVEALRHLRGADRLVESYFLDWQATDGLLIARRQETQIQGARGTQHLTIDTVRVNPPIDDALFEMPQDLEPNVVAQGDTL